MKEEFHSIIVRMPNWVGDLVMATPVLKDLRIAFPNAEITAMCLSRIAPLLEHDPNIDKIFHFSRSKKFFRRINERSIVGKLKKGQYDIGILLTNSLSSAWHFWQGSVQNRIGFKSQGRTLLLNTPLSFPKNKTGQHLVITYKTLLTPLGISISQTFPYLTILDEEIQDVRNFIGRFGITTKHKIIGISPGAGSLAKSYIPERFHEIAQRLIQAHPLHVVLFLGTFEQKDLIERICANLPHRAINLAGQTNLRKLMALIKICSVFLANDSGPMHIADSLEVPLLALFGPTDPIVTGPYRQREEVIQKQVACVPCFQGVCPIDLSCMKKISVEEVIDALLKKITKH